MKLVISDAHDALTAAITRVVGATWQRCCVHFMRNALAGMCRRGSTRSWQRRSAKPSPASSGERRPDPAPRCRSAPRPLASSLRSWTRAEHDVLDYIAFPAQHRTKLHSTNPLEGLNKEVKRRCGIFPPNGDSIVRLVGAVLLEQNDEWQTQNRYMQIEGMAEMTQLAIEAQPLQITPNPA